MTAVYYLPVTKHWKRKKKDVQAAGNNHGPSTQWPLSGYNSPGIILKTRKFMHFSKYAIIFTVEISFDIALSL